MAASFATLLGGCADEERPGTLGQLGNLRFAYSVPGVCEESLQPGGCGVDREVLAGSVVDLQVGNVHKRIRYQARSTRPDVVEFQFAPHCTFTQEADCHERVVVSAKSAGDADLEMFDDWTGTVLDRITVRVRDAASIETIVKETQDDGSIRDVTPKGGVVEVKVASDVEIVATPRASDGRELLATKGALKGVYADERVVGPRPVFVSAPTIEYAKANRAGLTTVAVTSNDARREIAFRVIDAVAVR